MTQYNNSLDNLDFSQEEKQAIKKEDAELSRSIMQHFKDQQADSYLTEFLKSYEGEDITEVKNSLFGILGQKLELGYQDVNEEGGNNDIHMRIPLFFKDNDSLYIDFNLEACLASMTAIKSSYDATESILCPDSWDLLKLQGILSVKEEKFGKYIPISYEEVVGNTFSSIKNDELNINADVIYVDFSDVMPMRHAVNNFPKANKFPMPARIIRKLHELSQGDEWKEILGSEWINKLKSISKERILKVHEYNKKHSVANNVRFIFMDLIDEKLIVTDGEIKSAFISGIKLLCLIKYMDLGSLGRVLKVGKVEEEVFVIEGFKEEVFVTEEFKFTTIMIECILKCFSQVVGGIFNLVMDATDDNKSYGCIFNTLILSSTSLLTYKRSAEIPRIGKIVVDPLSDPNKSFNLNQYSKFILKK